MGTEHNIILAHFNSKHLETLGFPYMVSWGKDLKLLKLLVKSYDVATAIRLIDLFFNVYEEIEFVRKAGITIGIFYTQVPKLIMTLSEQKKESTDNVGRL